VFTNVALETLTDTVVVVHAFSGCGPLANASKLTSTFDADRLHNRLLVELCQLLQLPEQ